MAFGNFRDSLSDILKPKPDVYVSDTDDEKDSPDDVSDIDEEGDGLDALPDIDEEGDGLDALPDIDEEGDGLDALPDIDDGEDIIDALSDIDDGGDKLKGADLDKSDPLVKEIEESVGTPEGIRKLIERHPEKAELWKKQLEALETLNDPNASPTEIRSAQSKLSNLKGQLLETAVKDAMADAGLNVEAKQKVVEGESGGTRPDVIAKNDTDQPIEALGTTVQPGETISVECKCGGSAYMEDQLNSHIPNQLSGQEGSKVLLTTSDIKDVQPGLAESVCDKYDAKLITLDESVADVEDAIKEVAES